MLLCGAMALTSTGLLAEQSDRFPCRNEAVYSELDFMLGRWDIQVQNRSVAWIELEKDGQNCVIKERYGVPSTGQEGAGIDYWDAAAGIWRRILVTSVGTIESFTGEWQGDKFVWTGREQRIDGRIVHEKVEIWKDGDALRNYIYQSEDGGNTWELRGPERRVRSGPE